MALQARGRRNPVERRAHIIEQALRQIGEHGYRGFTIQSLGKICDLSNAGLLHYFGSKDALLLAVLDEIGKREIMVVAPLAAKQGNAGDKILMAEILHAIALSAASNPQVSRFRVQLMAESISPDHPAHSWFQDRQSETRQLFIRLASGWADEPEVVALQVQALLQGLTLEWLHTTRSFDLVARLDQAISVILTSHLERRPS